MKKRILILLALLSVGVLAFAASRNYPTEPASFDIGTDSLMIMAPRLVSAKDWDATTAYSHGDMCRNTNRHNLTYWNVSGTTNGSLSATMPSHLGGDVADGGTNVWRRIPPRERLGFAVVNQGSNAIWIAVGHDAVVNSGIYLLSGGSYWVDNNAMQDAVYAISSAATNTAGTQEW